MSSPSSRHPASRRTEVRNYVCAALAVIAIALVGTPLLGHLDLANIAMLFPLAVLFAAIRLGRGPAVLAAFLSVALLDFFFVHPHFTLAVADLQYLVTFVVLLAVALITAELAARLRLERDAAEARCDEVARVQLAVESERLRNTLLASLSHDLRSPLTALAGLAESLPLAGPPLPPAQAELAEAIRREALRTHALARDLLDLARLQADSVTLAREWLPADEMISAALQARAHALKQHRLSVDVADGLPLLHVDPVMMERVLCNLLDNAVAHTPAGGSIAIAARRAAARAAAGIDGVADGRSSDGHGGDGPRALLELSVSDTGCGLPPGREQAIFERFVRGSDAAGAPAAEHGTADAGTGLGLAIVRAIVAAHGGTVSARNRPAGGACFSVHLPVPPQPPLPPDLGEGQQA